MQHQRSLVATLLVFNFLTCNVLCARILAVVSMASFSHQKAYYHLWEQLSLRGHQVLLITTDPIRNTALTNLTEIDLHGVYEVMQKELSDTELNLHENFKPFAYSDTAFAICRILVDYQLQHPEVKKLIQDKNHGFDLVIGETIVLHEVVYSKIFNCPFIGIISLDAFYTTQDLLGNPTHPVLYPYYDLGFTEAVTFMQRVKSTLFGFVFRYYLTANIFAMANSKIHNHLGLENFDVNRALDSLKLLFINVSPVFLNTRPTVPAAVNLGGMIHMDEPKELSQDLKEFLDSATQGVIYFSLGTNVQSSNLGTKNIDIILEVFSELPYRVLWKYDKDKLPVPSNKIKISKWMPQQDILRHANMKLFITQGGLQSLEEALFNHVPVLGMPFYGDQLNNLLHVESKELGLRLDYKTLNKETFKAAVLEIINNPKYKQNSERWAKLVKDEPMQGLEKAIWWTEFVLRHKNEDLSYLKARSNEIPLYRYFLVDVITFFVVVFVFIVYLIYISFKFLKIVVRLILLPVKTKIS